MRKTSVVLALGAAFIAGSLAHADDIKDKVEVCKGCHGDNASRRWKTFRRSPASSISTSSGSWSISARARARTSRCSRSSRESTNEDIRNLGAYFAALPPFKAAKDDNPDLSAKGKQAAAGRRCASCHGDNFAGTKAVARVAGQREDYLAKTLHDYKSSARNGGRPRRDVRRRLSPQR